ncbi:unnamed protein product [Ambrosiozyma monospora]|uniref:Unnamed protein product n=1 Tax=Ambrosiozyma monospora TaxID=43982 RepID=A0A9W6Z4M0_AMBMO|nr:unnamed protein product [Ambrosiozyma monospora]
MLPVTRRKKCILPKFEIDYPTANKIFTKNYNKIKGKIELTVLEKIRGVVSIDVGFRGLCIVKYTITRQKNKKFKGDDDKLEKTKSKDKEVTELFSEKHPIFESFKTSEQNTQTLPAGKSFTVPLSFEFKDAKLPSSCEKFGTGYADKSKGYTTISYQIFIRVNYISDVFKKLPFFESVVHLDYQGCSNVPFTPSPPGTIPTEQTFQSKRKILIPDESSGILVPNPVASAHRNSRFFRSFFDDNLKKENANKYFSDVKLYIALTVPQVFNLMSSLAALPVTIEFPDVHDLNKLEPDFTYKGESTYLGLFEITEISIKLTHVLEMRCKKKRYTCTRQTSLLSRELAKNNRPKFDVADLEYDKLREVFYYSTSLGEILKDDTVLFDMLTHPVMGDVDIPGHFRNTNILSINIIVSDCQTTDSQSKKFKFHANTFIDCELTAPQDDNAVLPSYPGAPEIHSTESGDEDDEDTQSGTTNGDIPPAYTAT